MITIAQSASIDFTPDPKIMRDDDDEVARAERNLINFMNEVFNILILNKYSQSLGTIWMECQTK